MKKTIESIYKDFTFIKNFDAKTYGKKGFTLKEVKKLEDAFYSVEKPLNNRSQKKVNEYSNKVRTAILMTMTAEQEAGFGYLIDWIAN